MAWAQIDDLFPDHPKIRALSDAAFRVHVAAICYCNRHLTDGVLVGHDQEGLSRVTSGVTPGGVTVAVTELVTAELWKRTATGYLLHDFLDWNPSRARRLEERAAARNRKEKERMSRRDSRVTDSVTPPGVFDPSPSPSPSPDQKITAVVSPPLSTATLASAGADAPSSPSMSDLEALYPEGLAAELRAAFASVRRSGRMADSLWRAILLRMAKHPRDQVVAAARVYLDRHADGDKDERYFLGILRGTVRQRASETPARLEAHAQGPPRSAAYDEYVPPPEQPLSAEDRQKNAEKIHSLLLKVGRVVA